MSPAMYKMVILSWNTDRVARWQNSLFLQDRHERLISTCVAAGLVVQRSITIPNRTVTSERKTTNVRKLNEITIPTVRSELSLANI